MLFSSNIPGITLVVAMLFLLGCGSAPAPEEASFPNGEEEVANQEETHNQSTPDEESDHDGDATSDGDSQDPGDGQGESNGENDGEGDSSEDPGFPEPDFVANDPPAGTGPFFPGTGRQNHEPLLQGEDIYWEAGIQGGHHIWVSLQIDGTALQEFSLTDEERRQIRHTYRFEHQDGELLAQATRRGGLRETDWGDWSATGLYAVLQAPRRPSRMNDDLILYTLEVELPDETMFTRHLWLYSQCCD